MPFDKTKNQRKGFCFITFDSEQVVNELLKTPKQTIKDKEVCFHLNFCPYIFATHTVERHFSMMIILLVSSATELQLL